MRHALFLGDFSQQDWCYSEIHFFANTSLKYVSLLSRADRALLTSLLTNTPKGGIIGVDCEVIVVKIFSILSADYTVSAADNLTKKFGETGATWIFIGIFGGLLVLFISWLIWLFCSLSKEDNSEETEKQKNSPVDQESD